MEELGIASALVSLTLVMTFTTWIQAILPPLVCRVSFSGFPKAMALPGLILIDQGEFLDPMHCERVLRHEQVHISQMRRFSPALLSLYLAWYYHVTPLLARRRGRRLSFFDLYRDNPIEQEAYAKMNLNTPLNRHLMVNLDAPPPSARLVLTLYTISSLGLVLIGMTVLNVLLSTV